VDILLALAGLAIAIWAFLTLYSPPKKHKDITLHDRDEATARALGGGSGPPDLSKLEPMVREEKRRRH
jgi:hypothetical protein